MRKRGRCRGGIRRDSLVSVAVFLILMGMFVSGVSKVSFVSEEKEMQTIENAVVQSAVFCYGMDGVYPESLDELKEHCGLHYNEEKYIVEYQVVGKNIRPQVRVLRRP